MTLKTYILLDRTGSMRSIWDETLSSINQYVADLKEEKATKKSEVTVACFDHYNELQFDILRRNVTVKKWNDITNKDATPRGMTPLFDAIGRMSTLIEEDNPKKAILVIMTDGYENCSKEIKKEVAKSIIQNLEKKKYQVLFLGADFDAFDQARDIGLAAGKTLNIDPGNMRGATQTMSLYASGYASGSIDNITWSDEDREKVKN